MSIINVIDNLYLGNWKSTGREIVTTHDIHHVFHIGFNPDEYLDNVTYKHIDIDDNSQSADKLFDMLPNIHTLIKQNMASGNTLVSCVAGRSRSVTIVMSYLMKEYGLSYEDAYKLISDKKEINPNRTFRSKLKEYYDTI